MARADGDRAGKQRPKQPPERADHLKQYCWKPGQSGNPAGRKPGTGKLKSIFQRKLGENDDELAEVLVNRFIESMLEGTLELAQKGIADAFNRIDGTPVKHIEISDTRHEKLVVLDDEEESGDGDSTD